MPMPKEKCYVTVKDGEKLAPTEQPIYTALKMLRKGEVFQGRSCIKDLLEALNSVQEQWFFRPSPQSASERRHYEEQARSQQRELVPGQYSFWKLVMQARKSELAPDWVNPLTIEQVVDCGPQGAFLYIEYGIKRNGREVPLLIMKL